MRVDPRAEGGFANVADAYDAGRPSYPASAVAQLARTFDLDHTSAVLDLAAGSGKLTARLVAHAGRTIAVEPAVGMLAKLREDLPLVDARLGTAEHIPCADGSVDAVFVGEAFHWFDTRRAAGEIARVLRPGGGLALLWNQACWDERDVPWLRAFNGLVAPLREAAGDFPGADWQPKLERTGLFTSLHSRRVDHVHRLGADNFLALISSWSWIANRPEDELADVLSRVRELIGGSTKIDLRYRTEIYYTSKRRSGAPLRGSP